MISILSPLPFLSFLPHWLALTLQALPIALWVFVALGGVWALWLLPRDDWQNTPLVGALAFACGSGLLTAWMFILGTIGGAQEAPLMTFEASFLGTIVLFAVGAGLLWRKYRTTTPAPSKSRVWGLPDYALMGLIVCSVVAVWVTTSFWVFSAYDTLWVYGYEGRLYTLLGNIPATIGYYPQYLPLQYAFYQLAYGGINDHLARVIVPFMHIGSILSAYSLGATLFRPRVGLWVAVLWALYPHVGFWAQMGDLEVPMAYFFTLSGVFFLRAWFAQTPALQRRYALTSGLMLGMLMWTKPTGGAFILGVGVAVGLSGLFAIRGRVWGAFIAHFKIAFWVGLACLPLGAVWYLRNALLGHDVIDFPHPSWLSLATRSGDLWGWGLLAVCIGVLWGVYSTRLARVGIVRAPLLAWERVLVIVGAVCVAIGTLPSMAWVNSARINAPESYMTLPEVSVFGVGVGLLLAVLWRGLVRASDETQTSAKRVFWALALAMPYFATWFYAYSYHYRLSFAVVPFLILPSALLITPLWEAASAWWTGSRGRIAILGVLVGVAFMVFVPAPLTSATAEGNLRWLTDNLYPDDRAQYIKTNGALMLLVDELTAYETNTGVKPIVVALGEQQLPFLLPLIELQTDTLATTLEDVAHATHYLHGTLSDYRLADAGIVPQENALLNALGRIDIMTRTVYNDENIFRIELYELHHNRYTLPEIGVPYTQEIVIGDFAQVLADEISNNYLAGARLHLRFVWRVLKPTPNDYTLLIEMVNKADESVFYAWESRFLPSEHGDYSTRFWQEGEYITDYRRVEIDPTQIPYTPSPDTEFRVQMSLFRSDDPSRTPIRMTINGEEQTAWVLRIPFYYKSR